MRHLAPALALLTVATAAAPALEIMPYPRHARDPVADVAGMTSDRQARTLFRARGLDVLDLTWEDTARDKGSAFGPNISDLTIQVLDGRGGGTAGCMPVVRYPNFADRSADVPLERISVLVGNERGGGLRPERLRTYLENFGTYQHAPTGWIAGGLLASRDSHVLTSAQACFLPVPRGGEARFAPVLFNYQSRPGHPAVLVILATPEGTSAQVIENDPRASAGVTHGQRLFHNTAGQRSALSARRFSDVQTEAANTGQALSGDQATRDGLSLCLVIQVPLVVEPPPRRFQAMQAPMTAGVAEAEAASSELKRSRSDVETAVVQAAPPEGPWLGLNGCTIRRDERFPIRATVQFYQATSSAAVDSRDVERIAGAIEQVYRDADAVGSLVVSGWTGRSTEPGSDQRRPIRQ
jgi:hypothetical protein